MNKSSSYPDKESAERKKEGKKDMSEEFNTVKLREEVNPVYSTAHSCLQILAALGDQDSDTLRKTLGFSVFGADAKERAAGRGSIRSIRADMKNLEYISSAELRVLLIMRKALDSDQSISLDTCQQLRRQNRFPDRRGRRGQKGGDGEQYSGRGNGYSRSACFTFQSGSDGRYGYA